MAREIIPTLKLGDPVLICMKTMPGWLEARVSHADPDYFTTGTGMGMRSFQLEDYNKTWKTSLRACRSHVPGVAPSTLIGTSSAITTWITSLIVPGTQANMTSSRAPTGTH